ncbi:MAG: hypothetical protein sL5_03520 [Candidatus Mesenet longicola]|uniref:Uncharacterized protein n=1 Tax=Candidatus Mesenet longicola TaxID=1892558 RepID=A0A8J3MLX2_9RICK|nr:MAG: hypothetical protein sGL2_07650 [Candidatus Mesenet longicola]GHM59359.1 MAG: hypothetical protein sL5_03520 [Candidatus Mesenet longicola]
MIRSKYLKSQKLKKNYVTILKNEFLELQKYKLKHELKVIRDGDYEREYAFNSHYAQNLAEHFKMVKNLIFDGIKHKIIDSDIYDLMLSEHCLFAEILEDSELKDVCIAAVKNAPYNLLTYQTEEAEVSSAIYREGIIGNIFTYAPELISNFLEIISHSSKDDIFISKTYVSDIEEDFKDSMEEAIKNYCTININGDYDIEPYYLLPIKDSPGFKEFKQYFKDIYNAINSNDLDKVKSSLEQIKTNIFKYEVDINNVVQALCCLAEEAKSAQNIVHAISDAQAEITFSTYLESTNVSSGTSKMPNLNGSSR